MKRSLSNLIRNVVEALSNECKAFLVLEVWSRPVVQTRDKDIPFPPPPGFRLHLSGAKLAAETADVLRQSLQRIHVSKQKAAVEIVEGSICIPPGMTPLLSKTVLDKLNCFIIGIEVDSIYFNAVTGDVYPLVLRTLQRGFARAIRQAAFEFSRSHTSLNPLNYQVLGRRAVVKAVWEVDKQLSAISNSFDFLLQVTPVNPGSAWNAFQKHHFERIPDFFYRPLPIDPALVKRKLYETPIDRVEDVTLAYLFRKTQIELDRKLTMLLDRGMPEFLYGSLQLFGKIDESLLKVAQDILAKLSPRSRAASAKNSLNAKEFAKHAWTELEYYKQFYPGLSSRVEVRVDTVGLMVSRGNLLIGSQTIIPVSRVEPLLQHEVGTHIVTYINGRMQPFNLLYCGLPGYEELQEGLAVLAEYLVGGLDKPRMRLLAGRVVASHYIVSGASFIDTFRELNRNYGFDQQTAFTITLRIYRGGGLTKDAVYLRGLVGLLKYLKNSQDLDRLFIGKISMNQVPMMMELQYRQILKPNLLRPRYLEHPKIEQKLAKLKTGLTPLNLVERN